MAPAASLDDAQRALVAQAMAEADADLQATQITTLVGKATPATLELLKKWKEGELFIYTDANGARTAVIPTGEKDADDKQTVKKIADDTLLLEADGKPVLASASDIESADTSSSTRVAMKSVTDMAALSEPDLKKRIQAIQNIGLEQDPEKLTALQTAQQSESNSDAKIALETAIAFIQLKSEDPPVKLAAVQKLGELESIASQDVLKTVQREAEASGDVALAEAARKSLEKIGKHVRNVNIAGTLFRGLSSGSVLLIVAIGLAITFGLMGVINMAHGEMLVVGAYTTYMVQNLFGSGLNLSPFGISISIPGLNATGWLYDCYFIVAIPASFLVAALVGIGLERSVVRFLYKRPLESLLATWGVSLVMQQLFRLIFGANNVDVTTPTWLAGNWTVNDVQLGWKYLFVIGFAIIVIFFTWLVLNKTPLGMLIRAVMQNRSMAACMGVRTDRVNMMTFGFGSGLAGLAGAFLSQITNVGPSLGQSYIVDAFMTVVVGGVGKLTGTVVSAVGIGVADQSLQQILLNPVLGKILVLVTIILFLQWRPSGIFVTRSRSLES
jgi:urea transport system permease protein